VAGTLLHSRQFSQIWYVGADGLRHYELDVVPDAQDIVSVSSWKAAIDYFSALGVPEDLWPSYEGEIDLPLEEIHELSDELRKVISRIELSDGVPRAAQIVIAALRANEDIVYCF
jgi:hypothetical protein